MSINISPEMNDAIGRMARRLLRKEGMIGRDILHEFFLRNDPQYARLFVDANGNG